MEAANKNAQGSEAVQRLARLKSMLNVDPDNPRLARECIDMALQAGDYSFVIGRTEQVLARAPRDLQALFDRGSALIGMRKYREAAKSLRSVLDAKPTLGAAQINLGLCHYCLGDYNEARGALMSAYAAGDRSLGLLRLLVSSCHQLGLIEEAMQLSDDNPAPAEADAELAGVYALVYLDGDRPEPAGRCAARALARNPDSVNGLVVQGTLAALGLDTHQAVRQFERALQIAPTTGRAWVGLGTLALLDSDFARAKQQLTRGLEYMPGHVGSWHVLAWAHLMSNDLDAAHSVLLQALELDRNFAETHGGLASIDALRGNIADARRKIDVALRLDPKCLSAQFARSILVRRAGKSSEAQQVIEDTLAAFSADRGAIVTKLIGQVPRH